LSAENSIKLALFLLASAGIAYLSRSSLRNPRSHGFPRFFAWECILALLLLNVDRWFSRPLSPTQVISWFLLCVSAFLVLHAARSLRRFGLPDVGREDEELFGIEKTTRLVTEGAYRYIRHPAYSSLLFLAWGIFFKNPTWVAGILAAAATGLLVATAEADEAECLRFFGSSYEEYRKRTMRFIPFLF
jgi:protein-S-isoprenylcysteine O-methyltransferase Ste14